MSTVRIRVRHHIFLHWRRGPTPAATDADPRSDRMAQAWPQRERDGPQRTTQRLQASRERQRLRHSERLEPHERQFALGWGPSANAQ